MDGSDSALDLGELDEFNVFQTLLKIFNSVRLKDIYKPHSICLSLPKGEIRMGDNVFALCL
jgi:hypothetical protein